MAFFNAIFFLYLTSYDATLFSLKGTIARIVTTSLIIFVGFLFEEFFRYTLSNNNYAKSIENIVFSLSAIVSIFYAPYGGIKFFRVVIEKARQHERYEQLKRADEQRSVLDVEVESYFKATMCELSEHYKFFDFTTIFKDVQLARG